MNVHDKLHSTGSEDSGIGMAQSHGMKNKYKGDVSEPTGHT